MQSQLVQRRPFLLSSHAEIARSKKTLLQDACKEGCLFKKNLSAAHVAKCNPRVSRCVKAKKNWCAGIALLAGHPAVARLKGAKPGVQYAGAQPQHVRNACGDLASREDARVSADEAADQHASPAHIISHPWQPAENNNGKKHRTKIADFKGFARGILFSNQLFAIRPGLPAAFATLHASQRESTR